MGNLAMKTQMTPAQAEAIIRARRPHSDECVRHQIGTWDTSGKCQRCTAWGVFNGAQMPPKSASATEQERIEIGGRSYRKFIPYPEPVNDGTTRCIACGQIDEPDYHDEALCPAALRAQTKKVSNPLPSTTPAGAVG